MAAGGALAQPRRTKSFQKAGRVLGGKALTDQCRSVQSAVLEAARRQATALRDAR